VTVPGRRAARRVIVTGAASGIGRALAELLLDQGVEVIAADRSAQGLKPLEAQGAITHVGDLTRAPQRELLMERATGYDALVNAAGVIRLVPPLDVVEEDWDAIFSLNAKAVFFLCQAFARIVPDGGRIVNLASVAARTQATPETCVYAASKAAVVAITRTFAHELGPRGVCVNAVLPGIVDTPMQDQVIQEIAERRGVAPEEVAANRLKIVPLGRTMPPRECAESIAWLLGPSAAYVTGQAIAVDGGYTMV
jgi:NAD(P)-dependent dehydrogenase (short-subunit alcohol dehydrogenase family)